ncbi:SGNH/GDSL hydrolase family protein [Streptomyces alkaliphilus]|uniref:SGNH/GDSL hydrolase family protein n=1 Tax=Streptomyces alkaliphilus TaxID=1472722 RepID=UPI001886E72C|nr:SGNH/GDSL hydrolase family protein [Streptomyces alkaliphilus]
MAAYSGGGLGLLGGLTVGVLVTEALFARRVIGLNENEPPPADGVYGREFAGTGHAGEPWRLGFLGDSTAAGLGVHRAAETPGALLATGLAAVSERPVRLRNVALCGASSQDLERQVSLLLDTDAGRAPDVCVIMIGANDITTRQPPVRAVELLAAAVRRLREAGSHVIVGTCPDIGSVEPVAPPLRWVARRLCRRLATAQTIATVELGGRTVSLGDLLGPEFAANPREMFGPDRYHPSAEGYRAAAMAILPTLCASLGVWPEPERVEPARGESVLRVADAAAAAVAESGSEVFVTGPAAPGDRRRRRALLKHRRQRRVSGSEPEPTETPAGHAPVTELPTTGARSTGARAGHDGDTVPGA